MSTLRFGLVVLAAFAVGFVGLNSLSNMQVLTVSVRPLQPSVDVPTFAQVQRELQGHAANDADSAADEAARKRPGGKNESITIRNRETTREYLLKRLEQPVAELCSADGRKQLVSKMSTYYWMRLLQEERYPKEWGDEGAAYIKAAWSTADDARIERLTVELYGRGVFSLDDFKTKARDRVAGLVGGKRPAAAPCGSLAKS